MKTIKMICNFKPLMIFKYQPESRKKDLKNINDLFFMSNEMKIQVESTILKLENIVQTQG